MVVGEMVAGILLGPLVLGALLPVEHGWLFPSSSLGALSSLASVGIVLFMFLVGLELRLIEGGRDRIKPVVCVAASGMLLPMALAIAIAPLLYPTLSGHGVAFWPFAAFLAVALGVTAFPVMARILSERKLASSVAGQVALAAAAATDATAWPLLAFVVALAGSNNSLAGLASHCLGLALLCGVTFIILKPTFRWLLHRSSSGEVSSTVLAALMVSLFACAALAEWLHIHAVFGAFLFGACLPRDDRLLRSLGEQIEPLCCVVLLPIFFALAGLRMAPSAFSPAAWFSMGLVLLAAVAGKLGGAAVGARLAGLGWRDSLATGALMNARGLMELVVIQIGMDVGLIHPHLAAMLLVMTLVTTALAGPLLFLLTPLSERLGARTLQAQPDRLHRREVRIPKRQSK